MCCSFPHRLRIRTIPLECSGEETLLRASRWRKIYRWFWLLLACLAGNWNRVVAAEWAPTNLSDQTQYAVSVWRDEQGLPQNSVKGILQSRDGYLWIATFNGLARFDGVKFTVFDTGNTRELRNNLINRLFEDSQGRLWLGHDTGDVEIYDHGKFQRLAVPADWLGQPVDSFAEDANDTIYILNRPGWILSVNPRSGETIQKSKTSGDYLIRDHKGRVWIRRNQADDRCFFQTINLSPPERTPALAKDTLAFASRQGGLWLAEKDRLRRWQDDHWREERAPFPPLLMFFTTFLETQDGRIIAGSFNQGLFIQETDGTTTHLTTANGLANDWVYCLSEDREGDVWVGTGGGGLEKLRRRRVEMLNAPDNWQGKAVLSVAPAGNDGLWLATEGAGIYHAENGRVRPLPQNSSLPRSVFWSVTQTASNSVWLGSWGSGLLLLTNSSIASPAPMPGVSDAIVCLYSDRQGRLWVGSTAGLGFFQAGEWRPLDSLPGLPAPDVRCLTQTGDGSIWFGTMGSGLCRWQAGRCTRFTATNGLGSDYVWSLWPAPDGALWIGTFGGGLSRFQNGKFATINKKNGLPSDVICHIEPDRAGNLWMSSYAGIFRVNARELNACADNPTAPVNCLLYDRSDGLRTREMAGGCQPAGCRLSDGRLCFASRAGPAIVDPERVVVNELPPPVIIEDFLVDGQPVRLPGPVQATSRRSVPPPSLVLAPGERRIELHYTGLSFAAPQRVHFRYKMVGLDEHWVDAGPKRSVDYSYLPPGSYEFHVTACNSDGVWNVNGAVLAFTVMPHYWQTWWFSTGCWLGGGGLIGAGVLAVVRQRNRRKLEIVERQRSLERERTRIAQDIHDELGAYLTRITMFSQSAQSKTRAGRNPEREVNTIFTTARNITRSLDEIVWAINPKHDTLGSLMAYLANFTEEFLEPAGISFELNFPPAHMELGITAEVRHDVFLAFKEALNNIVKHAGASRVVITINASPHEFTLSISDNGRGFDPVALASQPVPAGRRAQGNGLENMQKRLRAIGGTCRVESNPQQGTHLRFWIPLHE